MNQRNRKNPSFTRKSCVVATEFALAMMTAQFAFAQASPPSVKIEVTGSRIPMQQNVESTSPIAVITAEDIRIEGVRNTENLLYNMPQVFADQGSTIANGAIGTATVDLRYLGPERTLVLVNGKRLPAGSPNYYPADLNQIPAQLISRVEILTGGASAIYGSDAVAGVVNFIMRKDFQGVQGDIGYSFFNHQQGSSTASIVAAREATNPAQFKVPDDAKRDGESMDVSLLLGSNFANNRGNATVYFGYKDDKPLTQAQRDYSACSFGSTATAFTCAGSSTSFPGRFLSDTSDFTIANAQGGIRDFAAATDQFNFGPYNYFQRPSDRYSAAFFAHYDVNDRVRVYSEFSFHDDHTVGQIAPSGAFLGPLITVYDENPLLSAGFRAAAGLTGPGSSADILIGRRNIEGGGRQDDIRHTSFRTVVGVKGDIANWDYDVFAQTGKVILARAYLNDFSSTRITRALDVVTNPATGAPVCRSALNGTDPNCVPYDIFRLGGVTNEALAYLQTPGVQKGETSQSVQGATLSTDLGNRGIKLPGAKNGIGVAFGVERRVEKLENVTDAAFTTGDLAGQGGPTIGLSGQYTVKEYFAEVRLPIIEGRPMAETLSVNGSYRNSDYNTGITTDSYGLGLEWGPTKMVKLRASYQQAVRAPNIIELFTARGTNLYDNDVDPCGEAAPARTLAECARTGVTAAQYGRILSSPAGQYNYIQGGNPTLEAETAKSRTLGVVFTPTRNLSATLDYYQIEVTDVISNAPPVTILNQCLDTGDALFCSLIHRDPARQTLWLTGAFIESTLANLSKWRTSGYDVAANYTQALGGGMGSLGLNFVGTFIKEFKKIDFAGSPEYDCSGLYGNVCLLPNPEWRHKMRASWTTPWNIDLALTWRYYSEVLLDTTSSNPFLSGNANETERKLAAQNYLDIAGSWALTKQLTLRAGVNNLLDRDPPLTSQVGTTGSGNTYPQTYDAFGRRVFVSASLKF